VVYVIVAPIVAIVLTLLSMLPATLLVQWARWPEASAGILAFALFPMILLAVCAWAIRDYRRRALTEVVVHRDRIELSLGRDQREIPFDSVHTVRLVRVRADMVCVLQLTGGEKVWLSQEIAPFSQVHAPFELTLVSDLARRIPDRLAAEETISLRESRLKSLSLIPLGACIMVFAGLLCLSGRGFRIGRQLLSVGDSWIHVGRRAARGGFVVCQDGIVAGRHPDRPIPWSEMATMRRDACGIVIEAADGRKFSASALARNCWPVAKWIERTHGRASPKNASP